MGLVVRVFGARRHTAAVDVARELLLRLHEAHGISRLSAGLEMDMVGALLRWEAHERGSQTSRRRSRNDDVVIALRMPRGPILPNMIVVSRSLERGRPFRLIYGSAVRHLDAGMMCDQPEALADLRAAATGIR